MTPHIVKKFREKQLLQRLKSQDKEAFIKVYDDYVRDIYRFIYFKVGKEEEAQDLTSMVFLKAWNHIQTNSLSDSKTLRALVYKIARTSIIDYYRESGNKLEVSLNDEDKPIEIIDENQDMAADLDQSTNLELIRRQLPLLKEEYREVIVLRFINDLNLEEIAAVTGKSRGNVRVILHRALAALKAMVEDKMEKNK
ncbi:MAG TPA: sigma-70 family RNA polymerase sigma factor [bacterium]|jgi:RNA polymerase sigma-70 factor (ECF subfamily)|nr:MAG: ECF RNA polymerase sigma factor SigW [Parcubacteria group bacterium ADurb.Bin115]HPW05955.1 sigma-70 family RNA polymerase sigma factor [bacterium]HQL34840.1 sigma-70 family RNA polymerase sigma factor [bacterium]HQQ38479.1 sigma-70 family RNA polymerase sigma factor [bacterium]